MLAWGREETIMNKRNVLASLAWLALVPALAQTSQIPTAQSASRLTVTGSGTVYGQPDQATLELGVNLADEDLGTALEAANAAVAQVMAALREAGVAPDDIRTSYFNIWQEQPYTPEGGPGTPLYRVNNILAVTVRDTERVSEVLDGAIGAGANAVNSVQYTIADPEALAQEAREKAFANARAKAVQLAALAGLELGEVLMISDGSSWPATPPEQPLPQAMAADASGVPVTGGQLAVSATVVVQFGLAGAAR